MYLEHFGLKTYPFSLTPDTEFFFASPTHREALNVLLVALRGGEGFIKVTGEVGLGKTLLCRQLLNALGDGFVTAYVPNPHLSAASMRLALACELGLKRPRNAYTQQDLLTWLNAALLRLASHRRQVVLCLDEAQQLPDETLEAVRLLTNLETEKRKLLQVVLFGQPELDRRLAERHLRQLKQRITFSYRLAPMDRPMMADYVAHRLRVAGYRGPSLFSAGALKRLYKASGGTPRLVNVLCHKSLMAAFGPGADRVDGRAMRNAIRDTEGVRRRWRFSRAALAAVVLALAAAGWRWLPGGGR
ncbi:MAG TPA: AAA family ATPase [Gammaproteobacteria bacterium]|nr:AAA family ATPase [Gammaproteobacteria bacterium]